MKKYTLKELEALPTLAVSQADDLKIEKDGERIWLSRCTIEDSEPYNNKVSIERLSPDKYTSVSRSDYRDGKRGGWSGGKWEVVAEYQAE